MTVAQVMKIRIEYFLNDKQWSVNHLARNSDIASTTINSILNDAEANPTFATIASIAYGLGVTVSEFLDFSELNSITWDGLQRTKKSKHGRKSANSSSSSTSR